MNPEYQTNFSSLYPAAAADVEGRRRKARTIAAVLADFFGSRERLKAIRMLDVGAGIGVIDHALGEHLGEVLGIDIDAEAIARAEQLPKLANVSFRVGDAMQIPVPDESFDAVLCAHVYEHVPDARRLMCQIARVLKPGGVCYFAAGNRYQLMEPHYRLPFLSVVPKPVAHLYLRAIGRGSHYYESHLSVGGLRELVRDFRLHDYTRRLIDEPVRFEVDYMLRPGSLKHRVASGVAKAAYALVPTYIWLLEKKR